MFTLLYISGLFLSLLCLIDSEPIIGKLNLFKLILWVSLSWIAPIIWIYFHLKENNKDLLCKMN